MPTKRKWGKRLGCPANFQRTSQPPQIVYRDAMGNEKVLMEGEVNPFQIVNLDDYVATKVWTKEDVASCLEEHGLEGTDEQIDKVIKEIHESSGIKTLEEATDAEWSVFNDAIEKLF